jgi:hypothetical protein
MVLFLENTIIICSLQISITPKKNKNKLGIKNKLILTESDSILKSYLCKMYYFFYQICSGKYSTLPISKNFYKNSRELRIRELLRIKKTTCYYH